jgi:hypothetical protein
MRYNILSAMTALSIASAAPLTIPEPSHDRWMYPSNSTPGTRAQASTFSALPSVSGLDDRWGFFLIAFDTTHAMPRGLPPHFYRIRSASVSVTVGQDDFFRYDPSEDSWQTYATPAVPASTNDADLGRPIALHGAGFRNGFTSMTFTEISAYGGNGTPGTRNAYPLGFTANGVARDVSSNVTQQFDSTPWACGIADLTPGDLVPEETVLHFLINLASPGVENYLQQSVSEGRIWFSISSLHPAVQQGGEFVSLYTKDDIYHQLFGGLAPTLTLDIEISHPLSISKQGNSILLQWPGYSGMRYFVQSSSSMLPDSWQNIHEQEFPSSGNGQLAVPYHAGSRFFRLSIQSFQP